MIDRSYLPFQAAREHRDRGMVKWMGFFLSEHTASLVDDQNRPDFSTDLTKPEKLTLIGQLYAGKLQGQFTVKGKKERLTYQGVVTELSSDVIVVKIEGGYLSMPVDDILTISMVEETDE
ncbi:TPA: hypothetical protein U7D35_002037 [Streptococcus agalactiae]|nr:hypothetical protein [Streptococcus agalactiae]HEN7902906.1 hypothetical protein [Streptococcus agalactiae]